MASLALRLGAGRLEILDQRRLPDEETWLPCLTPDDMFGFIRQMSVRGAPLIGVAAAIAVARHAESGVAPEQVRAAALKLRSARPTAVNLMAAMDRLLPLLDKGKDSTDRLARAAEAIFDEDVALCESMANHGAALVRNNERLLTHCNAGGLATVGIGTAVGVIRRAHEQGKVREVLVDETRPLLQGARLTAWEMKKLGIPHAVICDNMAASSMQRGLVDRVFVGADRIAANGDFANKIGTYGLAVLARHHGIPFHVVAPWTTVDLNCPDGGAIPIEERDADEVRGASGAFGAVRWCPVDSPVHNPAFDVTPADLVESLVLDSGVLGREELKAGALLQR
jgi:methylthioribose-1-phosphate isomerase